MEVPRLPDACGSSATLLACGRVYPHEPGPPSPGRTVPRWCAEAATSSPRHLSRLEQALPRGMGTIPIILMFLMLIGVHPSWPHARSWGYRPTGVVSVVLLLLVVLLVFRWGACNPAR